jgi:hypothetical protein
VFVRSVHPSFTGPVIILLGQQGENNVKVKKAAKRLSRVEALLSGVLNGYATDIAEVREPLEAAAAAVKRARSAIDSNQSSSKQKVAAKSQPVAPRPDRTTAINRKFSQTKNRISPEGLKRIVEANKRRSAERRTAQNTQATAVQQKSNTVKKNSSTQRAAGKKVPAKTA